LGLGSGERLNEHVVGAISDHFFPWIEEQGHSPLAWSVLGGKLEPGSLGALGIAERHERFLEAIAWLQTDVRRTWAEGACRQCTTSSRAC